MRQPALTAARSPKRCLPISRDLPALVLAVSGGPDSTALLLLAARWREALKARAEADRRHRRSRAAARKPAAKRARSKRLARNARRRAPHAALERQEAGDRLAGGGARGALPAARRCGAQGGRRHVLTAHTLDDQAETVLIRMTPRQRPRPGSRAMARVSPLPGGDGRHQLVRPLLDIPKARLIATLAGRDDRLRRRSVQPRSALHPRRGCAT